MPQGLGVTGMSISMPSDNETLGLRFSVFGSCVDIPNGNCIVTVAVMNGQTTVASNTAVNNQQNGTFGTCFNLPPGTNIQGASVVVTCSTMSGNTPAGPLTIAGQGILSITAPSAGGPEQATGFPNWSTDVVAKGQVVGCAGKKMWLRLTDAGKDIIGHQTWDIGSDPEWTCDLSRLVRNAGRSDARSKHYNVHVSVWDPVAGGEKERVRVCSGFFSVGE